MKIAILSCFYPYRGGISQFNACLFNELSRSNDVKAFNFSRQYPEMLFLVRPFAGLRDPQDERTLQGDFHSGQCHSA